MARKIQLGLLITGMVLVGVSRFVATASASVTGVASSNGVVSTPSFVMPMPRPSHN